MSLLAGLAMLAPPVHAVTIESWARHDPLRLAFAQVDLTPPEPLPLGGYTERRGVLAIPGGDALMARIVVLRSGPEAIAWVTVECLTIPEGFAQAVQSRLPPGVCLSLNATHTHCAPDSQMLNSRMTLSIPGIASYRPRWLNWFADRVARGVQRTLALPGILAGNLDATTVSAMFNRGRRPGAVPPREAIAITSAQVDGAVVSFYTAHPTLFDEKERCAQGDWPGVVLRRTPGVVLNGPLGDVSPTTDDAPNTPAAVRARRIGEFVAQISRGRRKSKRVYEPGDAVTWTRLVSPTPAPMPHPEFAKANGIPPSLAQGLVAKFAPATRTATVVTLGRLAIVGISAEPSSVIGRRIKAVGEKLGFSPVLVVSHTHGWAGYVLDRDDYRRGGYEATLSFFGEGDGDAWVKLAADALAQTRQAKNNPPGGISGG